MSKYYKAEDVIRKRAEDLADISYWEYGNPKNVDKWIEVAEMEFEDLPTIDAVEVVRCKDCKFFVSDGGALKECDYHEIYVLDDDYCSYGERIE